MRAGWYKYKLNEVCKIGDGNHSSNYPKANEMVSDGIPFIRANNLVNGEVVWKDMKFISKQKHQILKKGHLKSGDLLFTNRGEIGKIAILGSDFDNSNLNSQIAWFRCLEKIDNRFLFYFLNSPSMKTYYSVEKNGAALQQFTIKQINEIIIPLPPLPEQQRIVAILDECFAALEKAKANAEQNLKNAKELFESYLQGVFEKKGEGWEEKKLGEVARFSQGIQIGLEHHISEPKEGYVRFIRIIDYTQETDDIRFVPDPGQKYFAKKDDIVMVRYGTPGLIGRGKEGVIANNLFKITIEKKGLLDDFLCICLSQKHIQTFLSTQGSATMPALNFGQLKNVLIDFPSSIEDQQTIVRQLDTLRAETQKLEAVYQQKLADLEELKKSILQKAFAGELTAKSIAS